MTRALGMSQIITSRLFSALSLLSLASIGRCQSVRAIFAQFQYFAPAVSAGAAQSCSAAGSSWDSGWKLEDEAALKLLDDAVIVIVTWCNSDPCSDLRSSSHSCLTGVCVI